MSVPWRTSLVIGDSQNRRVAMWQQAVIGSGRPTSDVVGYESLLQGSADLPSLLRGADVVRLESAGENGDVERLLILRGAKIVGREDLTSGGVATQLAEHGRIVHPGLWAAGYRDLLGEFQRESSDGVRWLNAPGELRDLFDKPACQRRLRSAGIPVPRPLPAAVGYESLRQLMRQAGCRRVFVKLPGGSSGSGVVALSASPNRICAVTSVELVEDAGGVRLFNSLRIRRYEEEHIVAALIDALAADGSLHVEEWVPKAGIGGATCDLRIVVIAGQPQHIVVRTSRGPLTNLHLGNRRGDLAEVREIVPRKAWDEMRQTCRQVAAQFPGCLSLGVDLAFTPGFRKHFVIEVNAFGDLLPRVEHEGRNTYEAQVAALDHV